MCIFERIKFVCSVSVEFFGYEIIFEHNNRRLAVVFMSHLSAYGYVIRL